MEKKFVLITGASGSIGKATAIKLAGEGYSLYLHFHENKQAIEELLVILQPYNVEVIPIQADLTTIDGAHRLCTNIFSLHGIVLNSGKPHYGLITDVSMNTLNEMIQLHMTSLFVIVQSLLSKLKGSANSSIVVVSSIWGDTGASCEVLYSMLKGGQNAFVKALSKEVAPMGIRVNAVSPGAVKTPMLSNLSNQEVKDLTEEIPLGRLALPEEIADSIHYLISNRSTYITGHILKVNGGWYV